MRRDVNFTHIRTYEVNRTIAIWHIDGTLHIYEEQLPENRKEHEISFEVACREASRENERRHDLVETSKTFESFKRWNIRRSTVTSLRMPKSSNLDHFALPYVKL